MLGSIEAGGTKFVCAVGNDDLDIIERVSFPTTYPEETMQRIFNFFDKYKEIKAIGIGSFGPIDINKKSEKYGYITSTPKTKWKYFNFLGEMEEHFNLPIGWTTDVNAACLAEYEIGSASEDDSCVYLTVGTGIGGGGIIDGSFIEGFGHPEMGHIVVKRHVKDDYEGFCPYHGDCLEGLTAGPSIEKRYGIKAQNLDSNHKAWDIISYYLAQALVNYSLILRPEKIVLGGGVMKQPQMIHLVREKFSKLLANYVETPDLENYIVTPALGDNSGILGGFLLAKRSLREIN